MREDEAIRWVTVSCLLALLAAPGAGAQAVPQLTNGSVSLSVAESEEFWSPMALPRALQVSGSVVCGTRQADDSRYTVALTARPATGLEADLTPATVNVQFQPASCLAGTANATRTFAVNLTLQAVPEVDAFARLGVTVNATLARTGQPDVLDGAEDQANLTVDYRPGLSVATPTNVQGLVDDRTEILLNVTNTANGGSLVRRTILNASATLNVTFGPDLSLNRSEARVDRLVVRSSAGCPETNRSFTMRFVSTSTDARGNRSAEWLGTFVVNCIKDRGGLPFPQGGLLAAGVVASAWLARRRGDRQ